jgi:hypothetical protein
VLGQRTGALFILFRPSRVARGLEQRAFSPLIAAYLVFRELVHSASEFTVQYCQPSGDLSEAHRGPNVASILPFIRKSGGVFDDHLTIIMGEAFEGARRDLHDTGQPEIVYEVIAKRIIDAAMKGERDPIRLRNAGLIGIALDKDGKRAN